VQVYLGKNYSGPGRPRIGGASLLTVDTSRASGAVRTIPDTARSAGTSTSVSPPDPAPPPSPPLVGGKVPCVS
jgi:hypothetical protein